jgi:hypothetical protein
LWAVYDGSLLLTKLVSMWVDAPVPRAIRSQAILIWDRILKYSFMIRRLVCGLPLLHE